VAATSPGRSGVDQTAPDETLIHDGLRAIEKLGPDQGRLQRRVDAGETSWRDIASGADDDPTAEAARTHLGTSLAALRQELEHDEAFQEADAAARAQQERATPER
jgi:hypothetical protein